MKLEMIEFHTPKTNQALEMIISDKYINMYGRVMLYTRGGNLTVNEMQQKLME